MENQKAKIEENKNIKDLNKNQSNSNNENDLAEQVKNNIDILTVINDYGVKLEKEGNNYKALCPFHKEKTPSFVVNEEKQIFTCFGCGASGDVINFVSLKENTDFIGAIKCLNDKYNLGIKLTGRKKKKANKKLDRNNTINILETKRKKMEDKDGNLREGVKPEEYYHLLNQINEVEEQLNNSKKFKFIEVDEDGKPLPTWKNVEVLTSFNNINIKYNEVSKEIIIENTESNDFNSQLLDIHTLCLYEGLSIPIKHLNLCINRIAIKNKYNPVQDYLNECGIHWNGQKVYIKEVADCLITNDDFSEDLKYLLLEKWLLNTVNIAFNEGFDNVEGVLVLQGPQGCGKTSFIKAIVPSEFLKTGLDLDPGSVDSIRKCIKYWVVELGELDSTMKSDQAKLKAFITESVDEYRKPYDISPEKYNRLTSFFGTVNKSNFLKDETGDRRYWVIPVKEIDVLRLRQIDKEQLWGEVINLLPLKKDNLNLNKEELETLMESNKDFRVKGNTQIKIESGFTWEQDKKDWKFMSTSEIANILKLTSTSGLKEALESCGAEYQNKRINGTRKRGYLVPSFIQVD